MKQEKILLLLQEASRPDCTPIRRIAIQAELEHAIDMANDPELLDRDRHSRITAKALETVMATLYVQTTTHRPQALVGLFPLFAMLCGDPTSELYYLAEINWKLVE